jgi:hypothetical protein
VTDSGTARRQRSGQPLARVDRSRSGVALCNPRYLGLMATQGCGEPGAAAYRAALRSVPGTRSSPRGRPRASTRTRMRLDRVQPGDVIKAAIKGRTGIWGEVIEVKDGTVYFRPLCPATGWRHARAHEVVGHWRRRAGGRRQATGRAAGIGRAALTPGRSYLGRRRSSRRETRIA